MINLKTCCDAVVECIVHDIWCLARKLDSVKFRFVPRGGNRAAEAVAAYFQNHGYSMEWYCIGPILFVI